MYNKKSCKVAKHEPLKQSYQRRVSAQAKIIWELTKKQPQKKRELCKNARISESTWYRNRWTLVHNGIIKELRDEWALSDYSALTKVWERLQQIFREIRLDQVSVRIQRASFANRDPETGWRKFRHDKESLIKGIIIPRNARDLLAKVERATGTHLHPRYDGLLLTLASISQKDYLFWNHKIYEVKRVEEQLDSDYSVGCRIGTLAKIPFSGKEGKHTLVPIGIDSSRSQVRDFLLNNLDETNITKDDGSARAIYHVIYTMPDYEIIDEFTASDNPLDGIYAVDEPESVPVLDAVAEKPYAYDEHVPISIFAIDKTSITGLKLRWIMEMELKRTCQEHHINGARVRLERRRDSERQIGGSVLYSAEFVFHYRRSANK